MRGGRGWGAGGGGGGGGGGEGNSAWRASPNTETVIQRKASVSVGADAVTDTAVVHERGKIEMLMLTL